MTFAGGGTGVVHDWDATYRRLVVTDITDVADIETLDDGTVVGVSSGGIATIRKVVSDSRLALHHFEGTITDDAGETLFEDVVLNPADHLSGYISKASTSKVITNYVHEDRKNEENRNIQILAKEHLLVVNEDLARMVGS